MEIVVRIFTKVSFEGTFLVEPILQFERNLGSFLDLRLDRNYIVDLWLSGNQIQFVFPLSTIDPFKDEVQMGPQRFLRIKLHVILKIWIFGCDFIVYHSYVQTAVYHRFVTHWNILQFVNDFFLCIVGKSWQCDAECLFHRLATHSLNR